jgi:hypothetical protein
MNRRQIRDRLERLEASMPIGKNLDRDRSRRKWLSSNLLFLKDDQKAEFALLNACFAQEDRDRARTSGLAVQDRLSRKGLEEPLTAEEHQELADLKQRYPDADDGLDDQFYEAIARQLRKKSDK